MAPMHLALLLLFACRPDKGADADPGVHSGADSAVIDSIGGDSVAGDSTAGDSAGASGEVLRISEAMSGSKFCNSISFIAA